MLQNCGWRQLSAAAFRSTLTLSCLSSKQMYKMSSDETHPMGSCFYWSSCFVVRSWQLRGSSQSSACSTTRGKRPKCCCASIFKVPFKLCRLRQHRRMVRDCASPVFIAAAAIPWPNWRSEACSCLLPAIESSPSSSPPGKVHPSACRACSSRGNFFVFFLVICLLIEI